MGRTSVLYPPPLKLWLRVTITDGAKDLDAEKKGIQTKCSLKFEHRGAPLTVLRDSYAYKS